jgi:hypothetical protein
MASFLETSYSMVHLDNVSDQPTVQQLQQQLEKGNDDSKIETMRMVLTVMLNGDPLPQLLMHIIRFVMPSKSKALKKLLYFYYEICPKHDVNGKLKQEMILVWCVSMARPLVKRTGLCTCMALTDDVRIAMAFEMTSFILTSTSVVRRSGSSVRSKTPNS